MNDTFQQISLVGFMKHNGGLEFRTISEIDYQFRARIQDIHLNPGGVTHGGFIMSLMDSGMGTAAHRVLGKNARAATISFDVKFISASKTGDLLLVQPKSLEKHVPWSSCRAKYDVASISLQLLKGSGKCSSKPWSIFLLIKHSVPDKSQHFRTGAVNES